MTNFSLAVISKYKKDIQELLNNFDKKEKDDGKWTFCKIGGNFSNNLNLKNRMSKNINTALIKDVNFDYSDYVDEYYKKYWNRYWDLAVEDVEITKEDEEKYSVSKMPRKEYFISRYGNKDTFLKNILTFSTYAILTPDGKWHEPLDATNYIANKENLEKEKEFQEKYFKIFDIEKYKNYYVTIVDYRP